MIRVVSKANNNINDNINDNHPIWPIVNTAIVGCIALVGLYIFATQFDETELKALGVIIGGNGVIEGIRYAIKRNK